MNQKRYKLSVGPQGVFHLLLPVICTIVVLSFSRPGWYKDSAAWIGISIPVLSYLSLVVLLLTLSSVKVFERCVHIVFMGFTIRKIPIHQITKIEKTNAGFGYMALAKDKILILSDKKNKTLISIKEQDDFLSQLNLNKDF